MPPDKNDYSEYLYIKRERVYYHVLRVKEILWQRESSSGRTGSNEW